MSPGVFKPKNAGMLASTAMTDGRALAPADRALADHRRAVEQPLPTLDVVGGGGVHDHAVVPDHQIVRHPFVLVAEARLGDELVELLDQRPSRLGRHAVDAGAVVEADINAFAAGLGMYSHRPM